MQNYEDQKRKKGQKGKLSQEEIKNLSTDELLSYIENEGKKLPSQQEIDTTQESNRQEESKQVS